MGAPASVPHALDGADREALDAAIEIAARKGIEAKAKLFRGNAADEIVAYADSVDADLIVVGSRGTARLRGRCSEASRAACCTRQSAPF